MRAHFGFVERVLVPELTPGDTVVMDNLGSHKTPAIRQAIRAAGAKAGLALNPGTPVEAVEYLLDLTDLICVMTVNPGFGGQKFIHSQVDKVRRLRAMIGDRPVHIEIDGGVTPETAPLVVAAGADVLVAGSAVFKGGSVDNPAPYGENIRAIRNAVERARVAA